VIGGFALWSSRLRHVGSHRVCRPAMQMRSLSGPSAGPLAGLLPPGSASTRVA
jgi:hypothetical protein